jgi:adenylate kinase
MAGETLRLVLLGPPGSGKGTQAALLAERLGIPAISTGDIVRGAIAEGSALGRRVERIVSGGDLVDDDAMGQIVRHRLSQDDARGGFLLDGYPRTLPQADTLRAVLDELGHSLSAVVFIDVPEDELVSRMLGRGRADDSDEIIRRRLAVYRRQTEPLICHYRELGLLVAIDGDRTIAEVNETILSELGVGRRSVREVGG